MAIVGKYKKNLTTNKNLTSIFVTAIFLQRRLILKNNLNGKLLTIKINKD